MSDPISIYAKYLECEIKDMKKELVTQRELANRLEEENADAYLRRWAKSNERAIKAERERDEALAYADKLAAGLPEGMLPKDIEVLRDANLALAVERDALQEQLDAALNAHDERCMEVEDAKRALGAIPFEGIRMASMRVKDERDSLQEQLDAAIMLGKMQERRHERELEQVREQYRLSSVCRKLMIENQKLKGEQP